MNYQSAPVNNLRVDPDQPRKTISTAEIEELAISIKNEGVINAIEVDSTFMIVTGERRWRAAKHAGLTHVPVKVLDNLDSEGRFVRQIQENIHNNTMTPMDTAVSLDRIRKNTLKIKNGSGIPELHNLLGVSKEIISRYLALLGVSDHLKEAVKSKDFSVSKLTVARQSPEKYKDRMEQLIARQPKTSRDTLNHINVALRRADRYEEDDKIEKLFSEDYSGLSIVESLRKINSIVPDEMSRVKEPRDNYFLISEKVVELMGLLEDNPPISFDGVHGPLLIKKLNSLGFYLQGYLQGKDMKDINVVKKLI